MRLLYITNQICGSGGLERVLSVKANYLADILGYEVHIMTLNQKDTPHFFTYSKNIHHHDILVRFNLAQYLFDYMKGIKSVITKVNPDIISVCDDGLKGLLFPVLFNKNRIMIYERHASINLNFSSENRLSILNKIRFYIQSRLMIYGAKKFNCFVVLTEGNKKDWPKVACTVIPNPSSYTTDEFLSDTKKEIILAVGSQSYNKGYDRLIEIWKLIHKKQPNWKLEVYGGINKTLNLQAEVDKYNLNASLKFYKPVKYIQDKYKEASIFMMTSRSEGFGMVLIEAMSFRTPCVAFDCPHGPADIIIDGKNGFLIKDGDIKEFADKVLELIKNDILRKEMGQFAKSYVLRYSVRDIVQRWDVLFKSLRKLV